MMPALFRLVTLQEAKDQLAIPSTDTTEDARIDTLVLSASQLVMDYIQDSIHLGGWCDTSARPIVDADGNPERLGQVLDTNGDVVDAGVSIVPGAVRLACLLVIANLDAKRGEDDSNDPLTAGVRSLLSFYRLPSMA